MTPESHQFPVWLGFLGDPLHGCRGPLTGLAERKRDDPGRLGHARDGIAGGQVLSAGRAANCPGRAGLQTALMGDIPVAYSGAAFVPWPREREMHEQNEERKPACLSFVSDLAEVAAKIAKLTKTNPARAIALHETLLAGC